MNQVMVAQSRELEFEGGLWTLEGGIWKIRGREASREVLRREKMQTNKPSHISIPTSTPEVPEDEVLRRALKTVLPLMKQKTLGVQAKMTVADFVEQKFVPGHLAFKRTSGRTHYQSMLKHVLMPEEVERVFGVNPKGSKNVRKAVPGWPYLSNVRLCDARPEHVERITTAALSRGYSIQTAKHIRNVVSAIFSHAQKEMCFIGENPAKLIRLSEACRRQPDSLTSSQVKGALAAMQYPEKEMLLLAAFTGMTLAEISGLQWKLVNLTASQVMTDGELVPPMAIAVARQWSRGKLEDVRTCSKRNLPIPQPLFEILLGLKKRARFVGPDDFVLVSQAGTPINQNNILLRRLKPIGRKLGVPSLSWHTLRRARKIVVSEFDKQLHDFTAILVHSVPPREADVRQSWHCRTQRPRQV